MNSKLFDQRLIHNIEDEITKLSRSLNSDKEEIETIKKTKDTLSTEIKDLRKERNEQTTVLNQYITDLESVKSPIVRFKGVTSPIFVKFILAIFNFY